MPGRVVDQTCMRAAAPAAALVEQHDAIGVGIEKTAGAIVAAGARAAVHEDRGFAVRIAALFVVDLVHVGYAEHAAVVRLDRGIQRAASAGRLGRSLAFSERRAACTATLLVRRRLARAATGSFTLARHSTLQRSPAKVTPFDGRCRKGLGRFRPENLARQKSRLLTGVVERALAAFDQRT